MADNAIADNNGSPVTFATDEIGGVHYPRTKVALGNSDVDDGNVSATNPMPVTISAFKAEDSAHISGDLGLPMFGIRSDSDIATAGDGDYTLLKLDELGRLKVSTQPASYTDAVGNITASGQTLFINVDRASNVTISMVATTLVGHNATFEYSNNSTNGSDGTWYGIQVVRSNANTVETATGVLAATPVYGWEASVNAYKWVRVRATAHTSGTAAYIIKQGTYATEPVPAIQVTGTQPVSGTVTATLSGGTSGYILPTVVADVASAAITTTTTTAAFTPTSGTSYEVNIPVTVVSGTTPTLDVVVQESDDTGTNWFDVYHFPRITATGMYRSPKMSMIGNRIRYVQTVTGTTPSFTRAINRVQCQDVAPVYRQTFDRSIVLTTLNSVTPSLNIQGTKNASLTVNVGAITTTAPILKLQGSEDNGATWVDIGSPLTAVASSTVKLTAVDVSFELLRAIVSTAGVGVAAGYVKLKGY